MAVTHFGKTILTELDEFVDPRHAAVVVVDVQNDFCHPNGSIGRRGQDMTLLKEMVDNLARFLDAARSAGVLVVYMSYILEEGGKAESPAWLAYRLSLRNGEYSETCIRGSWGAQICDEITPKPGDLQLTKRRQPSWIGTDLDQILRGNGIQTVITTGTMTSACVDWTARMAIQMDYYSVVPTDCVSQTDFGGHCAAIEKLQKSLPPNSVVSSSDIIAAWSRVTALAR